MLAGKRYFGSIDSGAIEAVPSYRSGSDAMRPGCVMMGSAALRVRVYGLTVSPAPQQPLPSAAAPGGGSE